MNNLKLSKKGKIKRLCFDWAEILKKELMITLRIFLCQYKYSSISFRLMGKRFYQSVLPMLPKCFSFLQLRMCLALLKKYKNPSTPTHTPTHPHQESQLDMVELSEKIISYVRVLVSVFTNRWKPKFKKGNYQVYNAEKYLGELRLRKDFLNPLLRDVVKWSDTL